MLVVNRQIECHYLLSFHSLFPLPPLSLPLSLSYIVHSVSMKLLYEVKCMQYFNTPETEFGRSDSLTDDLSQYRQVSNRLIGISFSSGLIIIFTLIIKFEWYLLVLGIIHRCSLSPPKAHSYIQCITYCMYNVCMYVCTVHVNAGSSMYVHVHVHNNKPFHLLYTIDWFLGSTER